MADLTRTVKVLFQGDDEVSPSLRSINKNIDQFSSKVEGIADPFAQLTDGILAADAALIALAVTGLALSFTASTKFESASVALNKILGDESDQIGIVEDAVIELSNQYGQSAVSILKSTTDFKRAGFDVQDSLGLVETGIGLVIGAAEAELGVAEATEIIIATLKGFNAPASEAARLTDILNKVSNEYATSVTELGIGMSKLAPISQLMGFSFEETAGILTPVIEIFRSGDEASTALRTGLLKLIDDAKPVQDALTRIGVAQKDSNGNLRSGRDILFDVAKAFETADEDSKLFLTSQLVGIRQAAKMVTVFDGLSKSTEITGVALNSMGSIQKEVNAVLATADVAVNRFISAFTNLGIKIGDEFRVASTGAIDGATDIEIALQKIVGDETFKPIFNALNVFSDDIGGILKQIARDLPEAFKGVDFNELITAIAGVSDEFKGLFDDIDLTTPEGIEKAIQAVVGTLTSLANVTSGIVQSFGPAVDTVRGLITSFNELDAEAQKNTGNILGAAKQIVDFGFKTVAVIVLLGDAADKLSGPFTIVVNTITGAFNTSLALWNALKLAFLEIVDDLLAASDFLTFGFFDKDIDANRETIAKWKSAVQSDLIDTAEKAVKNLTGLNVSFDLVRAGADDSAESIKKIPESIGDSVPKIKTDLSDIAKAFEDLEEFEAISPKIAPEAKTEAVAAAIDLRTAIQKEFEGVIDIKTEVDGTDVITTFSDIDIAAAKTQKKLDDNPITPKIQEITLQGEIDKQLLEIRTSAETLQTALEFEAKFDIAELETGAEIIKAAFEAAGVSVTSTGDTLSSLVGDFSEFAGGTFSIKGRELLEQIDQENKRRDEALQSQRELNDANIRFLDQRTESLSRGDGLFKIEVNGSELEPALSLMMTQIFKFAQTRIIEENAEYQTLLGQAI